MFPISSTAERSLFTNLDQHFRPLQPPTPLSFFLSLFPQLVDVLAITPLIYAAMGERGRTQSLGALFPRACLFFLIAKRFPQLVPVTPAWEALVDKEVLG